MADRSKFFRVAVEGATTDGRVIERSWIAEMADTYNPATYAARVNMEHIRGFSPQPPFNAYGDVLALKAEEVTIDLAGKPEKRLALFAQIAPTDELVKINQARQKLYTSIEVNPNLAGTGKAYCMGIAVTDSPASLGTELLAFAAGGAPEAAHVKAALAARKQGPENLFTAATEPFALELEATAAGGVLANPAEITLAGLLAAFTQRMNPFSAPATAAAAPSPQAAPAPAQAAAPAGLGGDPALHALQGQIQALAAGIDQLRAQDRLALEALRTDVTALKTSLDNTPMHAARPPASGAPAITQTDC